MQVFYDEIDEIEAYDKLTVAPVNSYALGSGCEFAMGHNILIVQDNPWFGLIALPSLFCPERAARSGWPVSMGRGRAIEIIMTGPFMVAEEALTSGLVTKVIRKEELMKAVRETAAQVLAKGPLADRLAKLSVQAGCDTESEGRAAHRASRPGGSLAQAVLFTSNDTRRRS